MSHRAWYAIRENDAVRVFYEKHGALSSVVFVKHGPEFVEDWIQGHEEVADWKNADLAEGGVAMCKDTRRLGFFGYLHETVDEGTIEKMFLELAKRAWEPEWRIRWVEGIEEMAAVVGVDPERVLGPPRKLVPMPLDQIGAPPRDKRSYMLVTQQSEAGHIDRVAYGSLERLVMNGAAIIDVLGRFPTLDEFRAEWVPSLPRYEREAEPSLGRRLDSFVLIESDAQRVRIASAGYSPYELRYLERAWPGWDFEAHAGGAHEHYRLSGRTPPKDVIPPKTGPILTLDERMDLLTQAVAIGHKTFREFKNFVRERQRVGALHPSWPALVKALEDVRAKFENFEFDDDWSV